ncbi:MAG: hypothetical protein ABI970_00705 [Chloroflexota bacterium]
MSETTLLDDTLALALKLSPKERIQLIERVASSVEREIEPVPVHAEQPEEPWGQSLVNLIKSLDLSEWEAMDIDDPVEWVKELRQQEEDRLKPYWDGEK